MAKIYLAESSGSKLFVKFQASSYIEFGYDEINDAGVTVERYLITFSPKQFKEILELWRLFKHDPSQLPKTAGYLKTDATKSSLPDTVRKTLETHERNISESGQ